MAQKIGLLLLSTPHLILPLQLARKAIVPLPRYNKEVLVESFVGLGEVLDYPNPIVSHLHVVGFAP